MPQDNNKHSEIEDLLKNLVSEPTLKELFNKKLEELAISSNAAQELLGIEYRTLTGILNGKLKTVNFSNIVKLASFLQIPRDQIISLYIKELEKNAPSQVVSSPDKIKFIKENFDLAVLKQDGLISSITDFEEIEAKLTTLLGLRTIFDYTQPTVNIAFSSGKVKPKNILTRALWIELATCAFEEINNPNEFDRQGLIDYFPKIRWHSMNVELGLINVIRDLFKLGVTVIYQKPFKPLHLRGATFPVYDKPCIVLTDYRKFYPTLWFALIHELYHVLFDWEEIKNSRGHLSNEDQDQLTVKEKEEEANSFAREYLFSKEKTGRIKSFLRDYVFVEEFAHNYHVHPSFIYVFHAYDVGGSNKIAWSLANQYNPNTQKLLSPLTNEWHNVRPVIEHIKSIKNKLYN
ncbi:MAG TPA: XRE family transcriptional regulator [Saprospiraceae bacterium]|nr:XRE family transcriptional regulator [Saprospiraceae bacterium]